LSLGAIRRLLDTTQKCSRSPTNVQNYNDNGRNFAQHSTTRRDDYYVTHGHSTSRTTLNKALIKAGFTLGSFHAESHAAVLFI